MLLVINTASSIVSIAIFSKSEVISEQFWPGKNDDAEKLLPAISKMLEDENLDFQDLSEILVVRGPGSFTGLRVGVVLANTLAYLNQIPLHSITTFELWELVMELNGLNDHHLVVFAGKNDIYWKKTPQAEPIIINLKELKNLNSELDSESNAQTIQILKETKFCGDISEDQKEILLNLENLDQEPQQQTQRSKQEIQGLQQQKEFKDLSKTKWSEIFKPDLSKSDFKLSKITKTNPKLSKIFEKSEKIVKPYYVRKPGITKKKSKI